MALVFLDTETTGLDPKDNRIIQCYAKIPKLGVSINLEMHPGDGEIEDEALAVNGLTREELLSRDLTQKQGAIQLAQWIYDHLGKRAEVVCHNAPFDKPMVEHWFKREGLNFAKTFYWQWQCTYILAMFFRSMKIIKPKSLKLIDLCDYFGIKLENAHEAGADVQGTIELYHVFYKMAKTMEIPRN
jgi:DNA polymerase III alpha subunit (gram-positive type)